MKLWKISEISYRILSHGFVVQLIVVVCTELLKADPSVVVRVDPIDKSLCPRLVVLREGCVELFDREKPVKVPVGALFKELVSFSGPLTLSSFPAHSAQMS